MKTKKSAFLLFAVLFVLSLSTSGFAAKGGVPNSDNGKGKKNNVETPTLSSLAISGLTALDENTSATFAAIATWSDGSTSSVIPAWSENSAYATISTSGVLTASEVTADQMVTVTASYSSDGVTKTATKSVSVVDISIAAPTLGSLAISGPALVDENTSATFTATAIWSDGSTSSVAPTWSENSAYATISTSGRLTASEVTADQTVTVTASYTSDGVTKTDTKSVSIVDIPVAAPTLGSLAISGPTLVDESASATFTATAIWSDGSTSSVAPTWSENSAYATISTSGVLTTSDVAGDQTVTVTASYTSDGVTKTDTKSVSIIDVSGPVLPPQVTLAWDPSTDPQVAGYRLYYKQSSADDPSYNTLPFDGQGSPIDVGLIETYTMSLPYDTTVFCFTVTAFNADGLESENSNIVCTDNAAGLPSSSVAVEAESGILAAPMQTVWDANASGGSYIESSQDNSGTAAYTIQIKESGTYKIVARVFAENDATDSFFVNIDNQGEFIWDLNPTATASEFGIWRNDDVTNRGSGTFSSPQYDPYTVQLGQGTHTITIRTRERNAKLDKFTFVKQ